MVALRRQARELSATRPMTGEELGIFIADHVAGAKSIAGTHPRCLAAGDEHCEFTFTW